jgi:GT2 family glycosyltransferase/lauroyl/myristoyl acyltransferase
VFVYYFPGYRKKVVKENLKNSFPEKSKKELLDIERKFYRHFADFLIEMLALNHLSLKQLQKRCTFSNLEILDKLFAEKRDVVVIVAHYNNWEWYNFATHVFKHQPIMIYKPLQDKRFNDYINKIRSRYGVMLSPMSNIIRDIIDLRNKKITFAAHFIADQTPAPADIRYWTNFLNQDTPVYTGAEKIASKYDMAMVFLHIQKKSRGHYNLNVELLFEHTAGLPEHIITDTHVKHLEDISKNALNFGCGRIAGGNEKDLNPMYKTAIVIINWNGLEYLKKLLGGVVQLSDEPETAIYVADNCSTDGSVEWIESNFATVKIIRLDKNHGFAGGYNLALEQIEAKYFVLINSDIEVTEGWLKPMLEFMDGNPNVAACQPKILSYHNRESFEYAGAAGGYIDKLGYPFCRGRIFYRIEKDIGQYGSAVNIFWSSGACMIIRAEAWKKAGGFDASFFAHMEEIDLCWRLAKLGYQVYAIPQSVVYHVGGGALPYLSPFKTYLNYRNNLCMLYKNLPDNKLQQTILLRKILDGISAFRFLIKFDFPNFMAVFKAHISYYKMKKDLIESRKKVKQLGDKEIETIFSKSIVYEFFIKGHKTFGRLSK